MCMLKHAVKAEAFPRKSHGVIRASPVGQRTSGSTSGTARQASSSCGPAVLCIAPSTPPPPSMRSFAGNDRGCGEAFVACWEGRDSTSGYWNQEALQIALSNFPQPHHRHQKQV